VDLLDSRSQINKYLGSRIFETYWLHECLSLVDRQNLRYQKCPVHNLSIGLSLTLTFDQERLGSGRTYKVEKQDDGSQNNVD
jgi:hypothetical protein